MTHKVLDKIDRIVALKRENGELDAWIDGGFARRYCKRLATDQNIHYSALLLYVENHAATPHASSR